MCSIDKLFSKFKKLELELNLKRMYNLPEVINHTFEKYAFVLKKKIKLNTPLIRKPNEY